MASLPDGNAAAARDAFAVRSLGARRHRSDRVYMNQNRAVRIAVCSTDDGTCIAERGPKNRSKKGAATDRIVDANRQISLFEAFGVEEVVSVKAREVKEDEAATWHLCVYHEGDDLRAELSLFLKTDSGYLGEPVTRIFLLGGEAPPDDALEVSGGGESEVDIPVTRKK